MNYKINSPLVGASVEYCDVQGVVARTTKLILHVNREGLYLILFRVSF